VSRSGDGQVRVCEGSGQRAAEQDKTVAANVAEPVRARTPLLTVVEPVYAVLPLNVSVPVPDLARDTEATPFCTTPSNIVLALLPPMT